LPQNRLKTKHPPNFGSLLSFPTLLSPSFFSRLSTILPRSLLYSNSITHPAPRYSFNTINIIWGKDPNQIHHHTRHQTQHHTQHHTQFISTLK
jgi:hypothetical protein